MNVLDSAPDTAIFHKFADPKKNDLIVIVFKTPDSKLYTTTCIFTARALE